MAVARPAMLTVANASRMLLVLPVHQAGLSWIVTLKGVAWPAQNLVPPAMGHLDIALPVSQDILVEDGNVGTTPTSPLDSSLPAIHQLTLWLASMISF